MNPNFFMYAKTEASQDGFIAWLCASTNNLVRGHVAKDFIEFLLGGPQNTPNYSNVEVYTQYHEIDVLVKLIDGNQTVRWIVIEDKTSSAEHDNQLEKYINYLYKEEGVPYGQISVVYYKTGHIGQSASGLKYNSGPWSILTTSSLSEWNRLSGLQTHYNGQVASFEIKTLNDIYAFFSTVGNVCEIINDYKDHIATLWNSYNAPTIPVGDPVNDKWHKVFDDFVSSIAGQNYSATGMKFMIQKYSGGYYEIAFTYDGNVKGVTEWPVVAIRARELDQNLGIVFQYRNNSQNSVIAARLFAGSKKLQSFKRQFMKCSYINYNFIHPYLTHYNSNPVPTHDVQFITNLIDAACDEYMNVVNGKPGGFCL